jgi:hypothetical protein
MKCPQCQFINASDNTFCVQCGETLAVKKQDPFIGRSLINQFRILQKIGEGGFGAVYLAEQPSMGRQVAVKILHQHLSYRTELAKRFHREGLAASRLEHPSALIMYNFGETEDNILWIAMELLQGQTLDQKIQQGRIPPEELLQIIRPVCEVLQEAHLKGIIHRDLKPENIFLCKPKETPSGERASTSSSQISLSISNVKLLDFGIAGLLEEGEKSLSNTVSGTPRYMPPEQWKGLKHTDTRSDIYSLGLIIYQALTAMLPFEADSAPEWMQRHCLEEPRSLLDHLETNEVNRALNAVIMRAIHKDPNRRHQTALELFMALSAAVRGTELFPIQAGPITSHRRTSWLGTYQQVQLLSQGNMFWVYQALWEGTPVQIKVPSLHPKQNWISITQRIENDETITRASAVTLDDAALKSALGAALLREQSVIKSTNDFWNHHVIALDNWSLGGFSVSLITNDHRGRIFSILSQEERRLLFPRMMISLWKALCQTPHGALSEEVLFIAADFSHFVITNPGIMLWQEVQTKDATTREALLLTRRRNYPILAPFEDTEDLWTSLQTGALGSLSMPKTPPQDRPLASDVMALGLVYYRLLAGENLLLPKILPHPAWIGQRSTKENTESQIAYQAFVHAVQHGYIRQQLQRHKHISPKEADLVEALILCRPKNISELIQYLW